jgi:tRNA(Ile)-lysidine synthetase-like protein
MSLIERVRQTVTEQALFADGDALVVAVSGGADSTALALLLTALAPALGARVAALAHLNHQLRDAAGADEAFCRELADRIGVPFATRRADVRAAARTAKTSVEDAARTVRYLFLSEVALAHGATRIAVGHTRDDQAETVLLRLARGAGPAGLAGIHPRVGQVVRPLLDARRRDIEAWLVERGQPWREDESNQDRAIPRNRVRHEIVPRLVEGFGAGVVEVLARQAAVSREDAEWFEMVATETAARLVIEEEAGLAIERAALGALHPAIARRVVLQVLRRVAASGSGRRIPGGGPGRRSVGVGGFVGFEHVEGVLALARADSGASDFPGQRVSCRQGWLRFEPQAPDPARAGRRRGRPAADRAAGVVAPEPLMAASVSNEAGDVPPPGHESALGPDGLWAPETAAAPGPKCAGSVSLEGHAPKGGRG